MRFDADGAGGTKVYFDRDAPNAGDWPFLITTLQNVSPTGLTWAQLSGGGTAQPPPPPSGGDGQVINSPGPGSTLTGGAGNDTLNASRGPDVLTGAGGADRFVFADGWGADRIADFRDEDLLDLTAVTGLTSFAQLTLQDEAGGVRVSFGGDSILLEGWTSGQLSADDFLL